MYIHAHRRRTEAVFFLFIAFLFFCIGRLLFVQFFRSNYLAQLARKQYHLYVELEPRRGTIYDTMMRPQAINITVDSLYASPNELKPAEKERICATLAPLLHVPQDFLRQRLLRRKSFVWLARKITPEQSAAIRAQNLKGLGFLKESKRCYPNGYLASHVFGFAGLDNVGLEGLELYYNALLKGQPGWAFFFRDARQKKLDILEKMVLPKDGYDLVLTIDEVVQYIAERELEKVYRSSRATAATIIVMDPHRGAILALANRPTFNLDAYADAPRPVRRNRAICDLFEPGSVFKIVTASAALEENKVNEADRFFCENGAYRVANHTLHDHQSHGWLTFREVIEQSSNIGTTKVAQILGSNMVYRYVRLFGFGQKTGVDLAGEIPGMTKEPRYWSKLTIAAIPIGQEVGVTALQLVCAISAIANGGQLMKPYFVREIRDRYGEVIKSFSPTLAHKVISVDTAARMRAILSGAVESGTGKLAKIEGCVVAGKTGTAQKLGVATGGYVASFIGFAPAEDPQVAIVISVDEPRTSHFGGVIAAPVFKNVAADVLRYLNAKGAGQEVLARNETRTAR